MPHQLVRFPCKRRAHPLRVIFTVSVMITVMMMVLISAVLLQPNIHNLKNSDPIWVNVGPGMFVFSAHLDVREHYFYSERGVVALAMQESELKQQTLYCLLSDDSGHTLCLEDPVNKRLMTKKGSFKYQQYFYICKLSSSAVTPTFVSFSSSISCLEPSPPIPVTQTHNKINSTKGIGVCIQSPLFQMNDTQLIIQVIEMNRILGAEWFTFYIHDASEDVIRVLEEYSKEGVVDVVRSTLPNINVHYYGEQVVMHDCGYRNMYKVKYLLYTDLDEIIVPQKHHNWSRMITEIDRKSIGHFQVRHVALSGRKGNKTLTICNSSKQIEVPRFIEFTERSTTPLPFGPRSKFIIKPEAFAKLRIHGVVLLKGYSTYCVPPEIALLYHYRLPPLPPRETMKDDRMASYIPKLIASIEHRIC